MAEPLSNHQRRPLMPQRKKKRRIGDFAFA
jgi:hypothetical protein